MPSLRHQWLHGPVHRAAAAAAALLGLLPGLAAGETRPLDDSELAAVGGRDGISLSLHLELNQVPGSPNRTTVGFAVNGVTTYWVIHNLSGMMDLFNIAFDAVPGPDCNAVQIALPRQLYFKNFGIDALAAQTDPNAPVSASLGQIKLNGMAQMQGQLLIWAK